MGLSAYPDSRSPMALTCCKVCPVGKACGNTWDFVDDVAAAAGWDCFTHPHAPPELSNS
jgi:hypothetical protein